MPRRGRCRCGTILLFGRTSQGYKTRCPSCQAVVRLRTDAPRRVPVAALVPAAPPAPAPDNPFAALTPPPVPAEPATSVIELEVYHPPPARPAVLWPWLLLAGAAAGVVALVATWVVLGSP